MSRPTERIGGAIVGSKYRRGRCPVCGEATRIMPNMVADAKAGRGPVCDDCCGDLRPRAVGGGEAYREHRRMLRSV